MGKFNRSSGILMPVSCLPSPHGIGCFSKEAYNFVDFLGMSHVHYWQLLPLTVTSYGDSPYQSPSSNGLNYYFIDLDTLVHKGLLKADEIDDSQFIWEKDRVDYGMMFAHRITLLKKAFSRFDRRNPEFLSFEKAGQARDFAFYMALKEQHNYRPWYEWPEDLRRYSKAVEDAVIRDNADLYLFYVWTQFEFLNEYLALKHYANQKGIRIIGDMPLYLALDSVEAYKYPEMFLFDEKHNPTVVAGCPPDAFTADGQLWGNPIYDWAQMKSTGYQWFHDRIDFNLKIYDVLRIDHFRGLAGYYVIPYGMKNARVGEWRVGPGFDLFQGLTDLPIIAEDLGYIDEPVRTLLRQTGFPGMKILEFAFDGDATNDHKPSNSPENYVCYTGTHDNEPLFGYIKSLSGDGLEKFKRDVRHECEIFGLGFDDSCLEALSMTTVRLCYAGRTDLAILPIWDLLCKDDSCRMNTPSTLGGNWTYRCSKSDFSAQLAEEIRTIVDERGRNNL